MILPKMHDNLGFLGNGEEGMGNREWEMGNGEQEVEGKTVQ